MQSQQVLPAPTSTDDINPSPSALQQVGTVVYEQGYDPITGMVRHLALQINHCELLCFCISFQTTLAVGGGTEKFVLQTDEDEDETAENQQNVGGDNEPPAKKRKLLEGHRVPVPDAIRSNSKHMHYEL